MPAEQTSVNSTCIRVDAPQPEPEVIITRRACGCIRTSDKLKKILSTFPSVPPPTPVYGLPHYDDKCKDLDCYALQSSLKSNQRICNKRNFGRVTWTVINEIVQLVQLSVTATALIFYYLIYCYMQVIYCSLKSALYFHNADVPMKITIGVVVLTSILVGFNLVLRMKKIASIVC